ncbi:MAG: Nif3-like dinuclear metal center hexameric protein [Muribaculaceae bacterium]|nr:Nif3-like dinuclear metal center hexameric protein [Muribaculaceae bacterium]
MKVKEITDAIEAVAPLYLQESWDNSGMQVGDQDSEVTGVVLCTDVREEIVDEAIERGANMIISHHPLLFRGLKKIVGRSYQERIVAKAIKNDITIYCAHTNMDSAVGGVNFKMAEKLGMTGVRVLDPQQGTQRKIVVFVPTEAVAMVEKAMCDAGAGRLGNYDNCTYSMNGEGHYRALDGAEPWAGKVGEKHSEPEVRLEVLVHKALCGRVVAAMIKAHPYEEPAFDIIALENGDKYAGLGVIGDVEPQDARGFLEKVKNAFEVEAVRYSGNLDRQVRRVAMCGGAGADFIGLAMSQGADVYITGDMKYHEFQGNEERIILADIGHYESEHYTKEIFYDIISKKNPNFAVDFAKSEKNQVKYL